MMQRLRGDDGSVMVMVAVWLPILILVAAFVVDVANWYSHKRHLQLQADAAALAGGGSFGACFAGSPSSSSILTQATNYAGSSVGYLGGVNGPAYTASLDPPQNQQIGGTSGSVHVLYNSSRYYDGATDSSPPASGDPCSTMTLDVKTTESNVPLFFGGFWGLITNVPAINARARISLEQVTSQSGMLPIAVPDPTPKFVFATFVDETNVVNGAAQRLVGCTTSAGASVPSCTIQLSDTGTVDGGGLQLYSSIGNELVVPISSTRVGVRLRLVGGTDSTLPCGHVLVECYDAGSTDGLVFVHGYSNSAAAPAVYSASLTPGTCTTGGSPSPVPDAYFAAAPCSAGTDITVDLGPNTGVVWAAVNGGTPVPLTQCTTGCSATAPRTEWTTSSGLPFTTDANVVTYGWCTLGSNGACRHSSIQAFPGSVLQRGFVADTTRSGPLGRVQVYQPPNTSGGGADSFAVGSTPTLGVTVGVTGALTNANIPGGSSQLVQLRVVGGSQNQSIDCDPAKPNLRDEIATGCAPTYTIDANGAVDCSTWPSNNNQWTPPQYAQPWPCVTVQTGATVGQMTQGLQQRILGGSTTCTAPIHWPNFVAGDRRIVPLIVTPYGTFGGNGAASVPIEDFGYFYITGWGGNGNGNDDPCPGADPAPTGDVVGHFIKYIGAVGGSTTGSLCSAALFGACVPVLTK